MAGKDHRSGHRARLKARFRGDDGATMPDYELLELLLFHALPRVDTKPIAKALLARFDSLSGVLAASERDLRGIAGIGEQAAVLLKVVRAAGLRLGREEVIDKPVLSSWDKVLGYVRAQLAHEKTERFHLLFLDRRNALIADEAQQTGTVDHTPVYPREVVRRALELGATAVIMVHNHPSGDPAPSAADIEITREVIQAAEPMGIEVHDHLVIGRAGHASLKSLGLI